MSRFQLVGALICLLIPTTVTAQINLYDMWIEPGCPKEGDQITLLTDYRGGGGTIGMGSPFTTNRSGNTITVSYTQLQFALPGNQQIPGYPVRVPIGSLSAGAYKLVATLPGTTVDTLSIDIQVSDANSATPENSIWSNPAAPGYGISLFRGPRTIVGAYYSYRDDRTGLWKLMQNAFCTPTGYAGSFYGYNNGNPFSNPDSAFTVAPTAISEGRWTFSFSGSNTATISERAGPLQPNLTNTRTLTRTQLQ